MRLSVVKAVRLNKQPILKVRAPNMNRSPGYGRWRHSVMRGRAQGRANWRGHKSNDRLSNEITAPPLGSLIESVMLRDLRAARASRSINQTIEKCQYMASFSWLRDETPTIVIPGMPPMWAPLDVSPRLEQDSGTYFRDINAAHYPKHPIEPAVRSVLALQPDVAPKQVDIFACGSTMGSLFRFAQESDKPFRFVVETIGNTVFLVRREKSAVEEIMGVYGYGHTFPASYTKLDNCIRSADSHQRLIRYELAGFRCIIRFECDGYLPENMTSCLYARDVQGLPQLEGLKLTPGGRVVPQEAIFDLKTRSSRKQLRLEDMLSTEIDRLWVRQIPNFVLAYHTDGVFNDIKIHDVRQQIHAWEESHQCEINAFSAVLAKIVEIARNRPCSRFEVCSSSPNVIEFREVGGEFSNALPDDLVRLWAQGKDHDNSQDQSGGERESDSDERSRQESQSSEDDEQDYTACSEKCGYCGRCKYY